MATESHFISQIQKEEKKAATMLKKLETDNNKKVAKASEEAQITIREAEDKAREHAKNELLKSKETAKEEYKKIIVDSDKDRIDIIASGKKNLSKAQKHIAKAFVELFE